MHLRQTLDKAERIAFFGGAGVSTESGIPDFRSGDGVFQAMQAFGHSPEYLLSIDCLRQEPELFFKYYARFMLYPDAACNWAHRALAYLEAQGRLLGIATQNIDGLHQAAGSKTVYELHGSTLRNYCTRCGKFFPVQFIEDAAGVGDGVPRCDECGGIVKPDVVLYEEGLDEETMENAVHAIRGADTLIVGGTSLAVYPAAGLLRYFRGENLVVINKQPTPADAMANLLIHAPIGRTLDPDAPVEV